MEKRHRPIPIPDKVVRKKGKNDAVDNAHPVATDAIVDVGVATLVFCRRVTRVPPASSVRGGSGADTTYIENLQMGARTYPIATMCIPILVCVSLYLCGYFRPCKLIRFTLGSFGRLISFRMMGFHWHLSATAGRHRRMDSGRRTHHRKMTISIDYDGESRGRQEPPRAN